jgi:hypothetical protein
MTWRYAAPWKKLALSLSMKMEEGRESAYDTVADQKQLSEGIIAECRRA